MIDPFEMPPETKIISFTGPSGSGKGTIVEALRERYPELDLVISCTTRPRMPRDLPGEYAYLSLEDFNDYRDQNAFQWTAAAHGYLYGTLCRSLQDAVGRRWPSAIFMTPQALPHLLSFSHDRVKPFFILPPPEEILRERLHLRGDGAEEIEKRINECRDWENVARASKLPYTYVDNSGTVDEAVQAVVRALPELSHIST